MAVKIGELDTKGYWAVKAKGSNTWTPIYVPKTPCKIEHSNVMGSDTGRDESGYMHFTWLRRDVRKVFLEYAALTGTEVANLESWMQGKEFTFKFLDGNTVKTMDAYVGESSYSHYSYADGYMGGEKIYVDFSMNVIEV